jgi:hypothetical protein
MLATTSACLKVYGGCIDGEEATVNARIEQALSRERGRAGGKITQDGSDT